MGTTAIMQKGSLRVVVASVCLAVCLCGYWAQSADSTASLFVFPRFVMFSDVSSGIAIFNPTAKAAPVTLTLKDYAGSQIGGQVTVTVPPRGQIAKTASELFGLIDFLDASLTVSSPIPGLIAYYSTFDLGATFLDGAEAPVSGSSLIFPVVPGPSEGICELDLLNPSARPTSVELKLWSFGGVLLGKATVRVLDGGTFRGLASDVFPKETDFSQASHVTADAKPVNLFAQAQPVSGTSLFAGFSSVPQPGGYVDEAALNALPITQTYNVGAIPYFRTGGRYATTVAFANVEQAANDVTVTAISNTGASLGTRKISLKANGGFRGPLQSVFSSFGFDEQEGWLLVQASGRVAASVIFGRSDSASLTAIPLQKSPTADVVIPQLVQNAEYQTEITLVNPLSSTSTADIYVVGGDGVTVASNQVTLAPGSRFSKTLDQFIPEMTALSGGYLFVHPSQAVFAMASIWKQTGEIASAFTPQSLSVNFFPSPPTSFAVTGKVMLNNRPAAGFRVVLSGPAGSVTFAAADGSYIFSGLPAGKYSMTVDAPGFHFVPDQVTFELKTASFRQNFEGFISANAIVVQPGAAPYKSSDTTLSIYGRDFNSTSQAYAGEIRLKTTYSDASLLQAVIPAYLLAEPTKLDIFVITNDGTASRRISDSYTFMVFQDKPVLTSLSTDGNLLEGREASNITLAGTGFLPGATVKINGVSSNIEILTLEATQIVAKVPASYFAKGGIYPVTVANPYPANVESNIQLLTVYHPAPAVDEVFPKALPARLEVGAGPADLEVLGYGFRRGSVVIFNGNPLETTYCDWDAYCLTVHLYAKIPVSLLRSSGYAEIVVKNPDPSLGSSESIFLRIDGLQPSITAAIPGSATALDVPFKFNMPVVVDGANFGPQTTMRVYQAGGAKIPDFKPPQELLSSTQMYAVLEVDRTMVGEWKVEVANPPPGGGIAQASFFITDAAFVANPFLISLSPEIVAAGGPSFTLTINGTNFNPGAQVQFYYTLLPTTVVSSKQVRAEISASLIQYPGRMPISVINPDSGGSSNRLFLEIR